MKVAIYIRVSTNQTSQQGSLDNQKKLLMDYIKMQGYTVYKVYLDIGSGTNTNRKAFKELVRDAKDKKFDMVLAKELSRLARNARASLEFKDVIMENEIHIITLDGAINTIENGISMYGLYTWLYENESRNTSRRIKDTMRTVAKSGRFIKADPPYGYRVENGKLITRDDVTPEIVRQIYRMYIDGNGANKIARHLMKNNAPTPSQIRGRANASTIWHESTVKLILSNRHYIGDLEQGKESTLDIGMNKDKKENKYKRKKNEKSIIVENTHEPIVSREDYFTAQKIMTERASRSVNRATPKKHLFSDELYCKDCGKKLWAIANRGFYVCGTYKKLGKDHCSIHKVKESELVDIIQKDLKMFSEKMEKFDDLNDSLKKKITDSKAQYDKKQKQYERKINTLNDKKGKLVINLVDESINKLEYDAAVRILDQEIEFITEQLNYLRASNNVELEQEKLMMLQKQIQALKDFEKIDREVVNRFVNKIVVYEGSKIEIHYSFNPDI